MVSKPVQPAEGAVNPVVTKAPEGLDPKEYERVVEKAKKLVNEAARFTNEANVKILPKLYEVGKLSSTLLPQEKTRKEVYGLKLIKRFAIDIGSNQAYVRSSLAVVSTWTEEEFNSMVARGLSYSHILRLLPVADEKDRKALGEVAVTQNLSAEKLDKKINEEAKKNPGFISALASKRREAKGKISKGGQKEDPAKTMSLFEAKFDGIADVFGTLTIGLKSFGKLEDQDKVMLKKTVDTVAEKLDTLSESITALVQMVAEAQKGVEAAKASIKTGKTEKKPEKGKGKK